MWVVELNIAGLKIRRRTRRRRDLLRIPARPLTLRPSGAA